MQKTKLLIVLLLATVLSGCYKNIDRARASFNYLHRICNTDMVYTELAETNEAATLVITCKKISNATNI